LKRIFLYITFSVISSFCFSNSIDSTNNTIKTWKLTNDFQKKEYFKIDTSLDNFFIYLPNYKRNISNSFLGNIGLPSKSNLLFNSNSYSPFIFQHSFDDNNFLTQDVIFFYTEKPFTNVTFSSGGNEEQSLNITHTQNVSEFFNFGLRYRAISTDGFYLKQLVKYHSFNFWSSYNSPQYSMYFSYVSNKNNLFHNGGIVDDSYITDSTNRANNILVKLSDAKAELKGRNINLIQKFNINKKTKTPINDSVFKTTLEPLISIGYRFNYGKYYKNYFDAVTTYRNPVLSNNIELNYYNNTYNYSNTFDSTNFRIFKNEFILQLHESANRKIKFGANLITGLKSRDYYYFNKDTLFNYSKDTIVNDYYYGFELYNSVNKKWNWKLNSIIVYKGYSVGNISVKGMLRRNIFFGKANSTFTIEGSFNRETNDYFLSSYYSNHFRWSNNFLPPENTKIKLYYNNFNWNFEVGTYIGFRDNFIFFDTLAIPNQVTHTYGIYSGYIKKNIKVWKLRFDNHIVYQTADNDSVIHIPEFVYFGSIYFDDIWFNWKWIPPEFNNVLRLQIGFNLIYNSSYYGYAYMPSIEQFYLQNEVLIGNYPIISVFANFKIKNTRIFVKYENLQFGNISTNSFTTVHYPLSKAGLKFGLSWNFYN